MRKFKIPFLTGLILLAVVAVLWAAGSTYTNTRVSKWGISESNLTGVAVSGTSTIDDTIIGGTTPAAGTFTTLTSTTPAAGSFTTLAASGLVTLTNATDASNLTTAGVVLSGGLAVTKQLYLGDDLDLSVSGTGTYDITLKDSVADALSIVRGTTDMMVFNSSVPSITITPNTDVVGDFTAGTVTSDAGVGGTTITASTGFALGDGDYIGVTSNEIITFNTAGTIKVSGGDFYVGGAVADTVAPSLNIVGDADSDGTATTSETLTIDLVPNATPTAATWAITSTQGAGYSFDKALTASGGVVVGTAATGLSFTGTYTGNALDFTSATINPTGANGPCMIRLGTYAAPYNYGADDDQSGVIRLYTTTSGTSSYDRGIFIYGQTTSSKIVYPIAGLAEANNTGTGPSALGAGQFIAHLGAQSTGAHLATLGGSAGQLCGMYGVWAKVAASGTAVCDSGSRIAPIWVDSQMSGTVTGDEYGIFSTTGASRPDAWSGFSTSSSGYDQLFYFDATFNSGAGTCVTTDAVPGTQDARIKVYYNGAQYYIPLYR